MTTPTCGDDLIKDNEGLRRVAYDDKTGLELKPGMTLRGKLTIGWGHNLTDNGLSLEMAGALFESDRRTAVGAAIHAVTGPAFFAMTERRRAVLVDMAFTMGGERLAGFKKLIAAIQREDWNAAADEILDSEWARSEAPARARRSAAIMRADSWSGTG